jgi:hypothetical protein
LSILGGSIFFSGSGGSGGGTGAVSGSFTDLDDVPSSYASSALDVVRVNISENGLEFYTLPDFQNIKTSNVTTSAISAGLDTRINSINTNLGNYTLRTETSSVSAGLQLTKAAVTTVAAVSAGLLVTTAAVSAGLNTRLGIVETDTANLKLPSYLTLSNDSTLSNERVLSVVAGDLTAIDTGANGTYTIGMTATGVTPGIYGSSTITPIIQVDSKGRIIAASIGANLNNYALLSTTATISANLQDVKTSVVTTAAISAGLDTRINSINTNLGNYTLRTETAAVSAGLITTTSAVSAGLQLTKAAVTTVAAISAGLDTRINNKISTGLGFPGVWNNVVVNSDGIVTSGAYTSAGSNGFVPLAGTGMTILPSGQNYLFSVSDYVSRTEVQLISSGFNNRLNTAENDIDNIILEFNDYTTRVETADVSSYLQAQINSFSGTPVQVVSVSASSVLSNSQVIVRQIVPNITTTLWTSPINGEYVKIRNDTTSGSTIISGGPNLIEDEYSQILYYGESMELRYTGDGKWLVY